MLLTRQKKKKIRSTFEVTRDVAFYPHGTGGGISVPILFVKTLKWIPGKTKITVVLNRDQTLTLRPAATVQKPKTNPQLPLISVEEKKSV